MREDLERYATSKEELVQIISKELKLRIEGGELKETSGPRIEDMYSVRIIGINRRIIEWAKSVLYDYGYFAEWKAGHGIRALYEL